MKTIILTGPKAYINQSLHNQEGYNILADPYTPEVEYKQERHQTPTSPGGLPPYPHSDMALYAVPSLPPNNPGTPPPATAEVYLLSSIPRSVSLVDLK